ncbi:hypothetical protein DDQ41_15320 [Streptomyces spongiicola]|uniref:Uncharacterized protein n=1 Tax=Streptomyces spongiicola TaxID=1690221 RepID=A0ABM6V7C4_9ACTN|nr:hypothetical protein DDQ41_15320 [Streptomyces spongiicola]
MTEMTQAAEAAEAAERTKVAMVATMADAEELARCQETWAVAGADAPEPPVLLRGVTGSGGGIIRHGEAGVRAGSGAQPPPSLCRGEVHGEASQAARDRWWRTQQHF